MSRCLYQAWTTYGIFVRSPSPSPATDSHINETNRIVLPIEWTSTMRPLQDQCEPTPVEDVEALFLSDIGQPLSEIFDSFEPEPIGVASLAQVHVGHHRQSGKTVAVKVCFHLFKSNNRPGEVNCAE